MFIRAMCQSPEHWTNYNLRSQRVLVRKMMSHDWKEILQHLKPKLVWIPSFVFSALTFVLLRPLILPTFLSQTMTECHLQETDEETSARGASRGGGRKDACPCLFNSRVSSLSCQNTEKPLPCPPAKAASDETDPSMHFMYPPCPFPGLLLPHSAQKACTRSVPRPVLLP